MDYIMIRAYGEFRGLPQQFIRDELATAHEDKAPGNAIYKGDDGLWVTIESLTGIDRQTVDRLASRIQAKSNPRTRTVM